MPGAKGVRRYTGSFASTAVLTANVAQQVVAPGTNVKGIIVRKVAARSNVSNGPSGGHNVAFIAKDSPPGSVNDSNVLAIAERLALTLNAGSPLETVTMSDTDIYVPPGMGLYFISGTNESVGHRHCLYEVLQ